MRRSAWDSRRVYQYHRGANEHRLDEYIETGPIPTGIKNVLLATVALAGKA